MELKVSSPNIGGLNPPCCASEPEEKEVSDEDDDDRNHKHRRRETCSQSLGTDSTDPVFTKSYRKRNIFFEIGQPLRENESQAGEARKNNNNLPLDKDLTSRFDRQCPGLASIPRGHLNVNQRIRSNQPFSGDPGRGRGRGRENSSWNQRDCRFNSIGIDSQMAHPGSVAPSLFSGRGLPNVSNAQIPSWSAFGMMPGIPNGGLDAVHPIGLQGVLRPPMNSSLNMGIPRQRCRDFEERGFCLRGDMCPMDHGVNRIVIEDVQSLSQFNLPVTVPTAQLAPPAGSRPLHLSVPPTNLMNRKGMHSKTSNLGMADDSLGLSGAYTVSTSATVADLYDPDQPLWNNNGPEASAALSRLHSPKIDETEPLLDEDISDRHHGRVNDSSENELPTRSIGSQGTKGRINSSRSRTESDTKDKIDLMQSDYPENETKEEQDVFPSSQGTSCQVKWISTECDGSKFMDSSFKLQADNLHYSRKPTEKALRTLFVNGIPLKNNKRETLLSHFCKFGEVIDIYIPRNSERAFVQFSRREEAEAALKAPDAVMGNRFIKLWWANRDSVPGNGINSGSSGAVTSRGPTVSVLPDHPVVSRGKDIPQPIDQKSNAIHCAAVPSPNSPKPSRVNGPQVPLPLQKKLETLEQMKEQLRMKQEMLEKKRNDFRRQLDKLQKSGGAKGVLPTEQAAKKQKVGFAADLAKTSTPSVSEPGASTTVPCTVGMKYENNLTENIASHGPTSNTTISLQESKSSKQQSCTSAAVGHSFVNKYKLDNRPTAFRVIPPLPSGFADVDVLKEHFLQYGDLSAVDLEDVENDDGIGSETLDNCAVVITYDTRCSAERAYVNGKCWQGNNLQFTWLTSSYSGNDPSSKKTLSSTPKGSLESDVQTEGKLACSISPEVVASGTKESKSSEGESFVEHMDLPKVSETNLSPSSSVKMSPKGDT